MLKSNKHKFSFSFALILMSGLACMGWDKKTENETAKTEYVLTKIIEEKTSDLSADSVLTDNKAKKYILIKSKFIDGDNDILSAPGVITQIGHTATVRIVEERYLPTDWDKPELVDKNGDVTLTPATPVFDGTTDIGLSIELTPSVIDHPKFGDRSI